MDISDKIQVLMLLVSTMAIVVSAYLSIRAINQSNDLLKQQMFAEYTKRFQEIILQMPKEVYEGNADTLDTNVMRYMDLYFNLCSEEYDLNKKGSLHPDVWKQWEEGMKLTMKQDIYKKAWIKCREKYYSEGFKDFFNQFLQDQK